MEFLQQNVMWVALAVTSGALLVWPMLRGTGVDSLSAAAATLLMNREEAVVLDVRESSEWEAGHIAGARHITLGQLDKRLSEIEKFKQRPLIVCCASGSRSASAVGQLKKAGFERVYNLNGGLGAWTDAGLPLTRKV